MRVIDNDIFVDLKRSLIFLLYQKLQLQVSFDVFFNLINIIDNHENTREISQLDVWYVLRSVYRTLNAMDTPLYDYNDFSVPSSYTVDEVFNHICSFYSLYIDKDIDWYHIRNNQEEMLLFSCFVNSFICSLYDNVDFGLVFIDELKNYTNDISQDDVIQQEVVINWPVDSKYIN